ncbi:uncharacterized protein LOC130675990 [Microplitis mediator]|uniref:uncharacterized protein LOC130675990 n=1 Tax=Microplitis mediator TaxID=375433 RepID=UPI002554B377|nr:uncharacterized protein LOC130675990 [Microplitis mediator]
MTKNNIMNKLTRNYDQTNTCVLSSQRILRSTNQVNSNKTNEPTKNGFVPRISPRRKKPFEPTLLPASKKNQDSNINSSSTETTTDSMSTICKEKFLDKLDLHVKPKDKSSESITCELCDKKFLNEDKLRYHVLRVHKIVNYKVPIIKMSNRSKTSSNLKAQARIIRKRIRRFVFIRKYCDLGNSQFGKFHNRFVTKATEERKERRKIFRQQIEKNFDNKSNSNSCIDVNEIDDKSNLQLPTSTVEIDEGSKDNLNDNPISSTSENGEYASQKNIFINKFKEFVLTNGDIINLPTLNNLESKSTDSDDALPTSSRSNLSNELRNDKLTERQNTDPGKYTGLKNLKDTESSSVSTSPDPVVRKIYPGKKKSKDQVVYSLSFPKENQMNQKYCNSCTGVMKLMVENYKLSDEPGADRIDCKFCCHKFRSVNKLNRHVALFHLNCNCIRLPNFWDSSVSVDTKQLDLNGDTAMTYHCQICSADYKDYKKFNFHRFYVHELEPLSEEMPDGTPKYLKDINNNFMVGPWVSSASKTNYFGKKINNDDYEDYDLEVDLFPIVCHKCNEIFFNNCKYVRHLNNCYSDFHFKPLAPITQFPATFKSRNFEEPRESSLKLKTDGHLNWEIKSNIKLQFFKNNVRAKPRNPRNYASNYDQLRKTCRKCNREFNSVKEINDHYFVEHASNNNVDGNNKDSLSKNKNNDKCESTNDDIDENTITYDHYKTESWYGHKVIHKWQCLHCKLSFKIFRAYSNHLFFEHNDESLVHICENCDEIITSIDKVNKHICVNVSSWTCKLCDESFATSIDFRAHNTKTHFEVAEPNLCLGCGKKFLTHYMVLRHWKKNTCASERAIEDLISSYQTNEPAGVELRNEKEKNEDQAIDDYIISIVDNIAMESEEERRVEDKALDDTGNLSGLLAVNQDAEGRTTEARIKSKETETSFEEDVEKIIKVLEEKEEETAGDKLEETKKQIQDTDDETIKESNEEIINDDTADEQIFDDVPMDEESIEDTNDDQSDDNSEDDDNGDEDLDDEELDDEEQDDEEFDEEESVDTFDNCDELKTLNEDNYNKLIEIHEKCNKVVNLNEDTYDELEGIKNYVLKNEQSPGDDCRKSDLSGNLNRRKRASEVTNDGVESLVDKKKKLTNINDNFNAQVELSNGQEKTTSVNNSADKSSASSFRCSMCKLQFSSMVLLNNHFNRAHVSAVEICQLCHKMYITGNLIKHLVNDHFITYTIIVDKIIKNEISIERDTRDFIGIIGKMQLLALCKYQEPPQASSDESVDCSDCPLTFENADKYRIHYVEVHDKFCALCLTKHRNGREASRHKIKFHSSIACYVWFASKVINAIGDTDTFKEAVGLKPRRKNKAVDKEESNSTFKDKILDVLHESKPALDKFNSEIQSTIKNNKTKNDAQYSCQSTENNSPIKSDSSASAVMNKNYTENEAHEFSMVNESGMENNEADKFALSSEVSTQDNGEKLIIIQCPNLILKKENSINSTSDCNEEDDSADHKLVIVVTESDLEKYKDNLRELAKRFDNLSHIFSTDEITQLLTAHLNDK